MTATATTARPGLRIATIAGIPVYVSSSWLVLAALILYWGTSDTSLPRGTAVLLSVLRAVVLLVSVLVHEAAHALVARACGIPVLRVVANFFGGHTAFEARGLRPGPAALVALAGPTANLLLAVACWPLGQAVEGIPGQVLRSAAFINALLAAFNLLPGLPLDGGAAVSAGIWRITGRRSSGMRVGGWLGVALAVALALWAAAGFSEADSRLWTLVMAGVIGMAAYASVGAARQLAVLDGLTAADVAAPATSLPVDGTAADIPHGALGVVPDERGLPVLLVATPPESVAPDTPVTALVQRFPDDSVRELARSTPALELVGLLRGAGATTLVLTEHGRPWGVVTTPQLNGLLRERSTR